MVPDLDTARVVTTLVAGDQFVLIRLLLDALQAEVGDQLTTVEMELNWPREPFGPVAEVHEAAGTEELLLGLIRGVEIAVTEMAPFTKRVIAAADALRLIVVCRGGPVNVNLAAATERGIPVCYTPARNAAATAEYTIGLLLAAMRRMAEGHKDLIRGVWRGDFYAYTRRDGAGRKDGRTGRLRCRWAPGCSRVAGVRGRGVRRRSLCRLGRCQGRRRHGRRVRRTPAACRDTEPACATDAGDPPPDRPR